MNEDLLEFAHAWKAGDTAPVHPTVGRRLNACLLKAGEDAVPLARGADHSAPSLSELLFREHACASGDGYTPSDASRRPYSVANEHERAA